jgi:1-acyl-sn-glycerol-3-phosphate acyltransferase
MLKSVIWGICKVQVHGLERLDNVEPPFIVVSNHSSHLDAPLIVGALPHRLSKNLATGAAADYFFDKRVKGMATSLFFNAYPIERKGLRTRQGLTGRLLDAGVPLLVFPEGTRSRTGAMGPFKPGVAALSISRDVPCLPVALVGAYAAWPYYRSIPPTDRPQVHVVFGHPVTAVAGEIAHQFAQRLGRNVAELYNTTARAYGMPTLDDYERSVVLSRAKRSQDQAELAGPSDAASPTGAVGAGADGPDGPDGSGPAPGQSLDRTGPTPDQSPDRTGPASGRSRRRAGRSRSRAVQPIGSGGAGQSDGSDDPDGSGGTAATAPLGAGPDPAVESDRLPPEAPFSETRTGSGRGSASQRPGVSEADPPSQRRTRPGRGAESERSAELKPEADSQPEATGERRPRRRLFGRRG